MRLGPSLVGAIIGAVVGIAVQVGVESGLGMESTWLAIVIGVLTGFGARTMAGEYIRSASYLRGGLAAIIALGAIMGGSYAASSMIRKSNAKSMDAMPAVDVAALEAKEEASEAEAADADADADAEGVEQDPGALEDDAAEDDAATADDTEDNDEAEAGASDDNDASDGDSTGDSADEEMQAADANDEASDEAVAAAEESFSLSGTQARPTAGERLGNTTKTVPFSTTQAIFMGLGVFLAYEFARGGGKGESTPS